MYVFAYAPYVARPGSISIWEWGLALAYAGAVEGATFVFVAHNRKRAANGFALASFAINLCYYAMHGVDLFTLAAIPRWILSALLPLGIAAYSHIFGHIADGGESTVADQPSILAAVGEHWRNWRSRRQEATEPPTDDETTAPAQTDDEATEEPPEPQESAVGATWDLSSMDLETKRRRAARLMDEPGRTLEDVAAIFGVNPSTISRWVAKVKAEATA